MKKLNNKLTVIALIVLIMFGISGPTSVSAAGPAVVDLGTAGNFVILGKTGVSTVGSAVVTGDVGLSPAAATFITGFSLIADASNTFSSSSQVTGKVYAANYAPPTPAYMTAAVSAMEAAYTDAAGRTSPTSTNLGAGTLSGQVLAPGLYKWTTGVTITGDITLNGSSTDVWIMQISGTLDISSAKKILLTGGALAKNVFWQVTGDVSLGTTSVFEGNILGQTLIALNTGATLHGRALAQTAVTLAAGAVVSVPAGSAPATLRVIKLVVSGYTGNTAASGFSIHVKSVGVDVVGSPIAGAAAPGTAYALSAGTYVVSEDANTSYAQSFSASCPGGSITLASGDDKTCTIINTDITPAPSGATYYSPATIVPVIGILKVPSPLAISSASGLVTYGYTVWNVGGLQALTNVAVVDDKCSPVALLSGDANGNGKLDPGENWKYSCATTLTKTTTNTAVATGYSDDGAHQAAAATAIATVVVGAPLTPPLINVVKVPSQLTPFPFGGGNVTYTYAVTNPGVVAMHDVVIADDKCSPLSGPFGDANGNNLLEPGETWSYACATNITVSTKNTATVEGKANGFTAIGYAFSTVLVSAPGLPNTGLPPENNLWSILALLGILAIGLIVRNVILKKEKI